MFLEAMMRLFRHEDLSKLKQPDLDRYETVCGLEALRLWGDFERVPIKENLDAWRAFWDAELDPVVAEQIRRIVGICAAKNGPGGVQV